MEKGARGRGGGEEKLFFLYLFFHPPNPYPASAPTLYRSSIQLHPRRRHRADLSSVLAIILHKIHLSSFQALSQ